MLIILKPWCLNIVQYLLEQWFNYLYLYFMFKLFSKKFNNDITDLKFQWKDEKTKSVCTLTVNIVLRSDVLLLKRWDNLAIIFSSLVLIFNMTYFDINSRKVKDFTNITLTCTKFTHCALCVYYNILFKINQVTHFLTIQITHTLFNQLYIIFDIIISKLK